MPMTVHNGNNSTLGRHIPCHYCAAPCFFTSHSSEFVVSGFSGPRSVTELSRLSFDKYLKKNMVFVLHHDKIKFVKYKINLSILEYVRDPREETGNDR